MSYKDLKTYQGAVIIYDFTVKFCNCYLSNKSKWSNKSYRTYDQMVQAARSGKQNIVEASTQRTSKKGELKLLGVARASLQELLEDYEDFLRQRDFSQWRKDSPQARQVRGLVYRSNWSYMSYKSYLSNLEASANAMICLINQVNFLLDRQIRALKEKFVSEGGWTENIFRQRLAKRNRSNKSDRSYKSNTVYEKSK